MENLEKVLESLDLVQVQEGWAGKSYIGKDTTVCHCDVFISTEAAMKDGIAPCIVNYSTNDKAITKRIKELTPNKLIAVLAKLNYQPALVLVELQNSCSA